METVKVDDIGHVRRIRIARPEKKNALTADMYSALAEAVAAAGRTGSVHVVLFAGAPGAPGTPGVFTAGNDLQDFLERPPTGPESPVFRFLTAVTTFQKPIVAAVDGPAVGIGTTLLLHCDLVVAAQTARFALPFVKLGLVPEAASSWLLPRLAGLQRASEWLLLGEPFTAEEAREAGLVNRVVESGELEATALGLAQAVAARPPEAVQLSRKLIRSQLDRRIAQAITEESEAFVPRLSSLEARAAFSAFLTKRK
jgi:enoyl-CoA hydratase/carnithine racemase